MGHTRELKVLSNALDRIHSGLATIGIILDEHYADDRETRALWDSMHMNTLVSMRRLRQHLDIPYNLQEDSK